MRCSASCSALRWISVQALHTLPDVDAMKSLIHELPLAIVDSSTNTDDTYLTALKVHATACMCSALMLIHADAMNMQQATSKHRRHQPASTVTRSQQLQPDLDNGVLTLPGASIRCA
jgi:SUMO ligase MMS21 Smc5/6 complex component